MDQPSWCPEAFLPKYWQSRCTWTERWSAGRQSWHPWGWRSGADRDWCWTGTGSSRSKLTKASCELAGVYPRPPGWRPPGFRIGRVRWNPRRARPDDCSIEGWNIGHPDCQGALHHLTTQTWLLLQNHFLFISLIKILIVVLLMKLMVQQRSKQQNELSLFYNWHNDNSLFFAFSEQNRGERAHTLQ